MRGSDSDGSGTEGLRFNLVIVKWSLLILCLIGAVMAVAQTPKLSVRGKDLVDPEGKVVPLRGCNLGNWLMIEFWMLGLDNKAGVTDQHDLFQTLDSRFGRHKREELIDLYRSRWIIDADFDTIKSFRFNVVRLPMDYRLFEDDANPYHLRADAFKWTDRCIEMAKNKGIYVILDMHGIQGGQSPYDHTGWSGQNHFWDVPDNLKRAEWLWEQIAKKYKDEPAVVAYDLANEPYGGTHDQEKLAYPRLLAGVRSVDPDKLVYLMGHYDDFTFYGDPAPQGWHNVGFQMHYYPGLFGNGNPTLVTHARHLASLKPTEEIIDKWNVPFLVGEMNPVFASVGIDMMRRHFDQHASHGWATTMWSYKLMTEKGSFDGGSWGMVTNADPVTPINFKTASLEEITGWINALGTRKWIVYDALRATMAPEKVALAPLPKEPPRRTTPPTAVEKPSWTSRPIGDAMAGSVVSKGDGADLYGSGGDVWGGSDAFQFLFQSVVGDFVATAQIDSMDQLEAYAKAGWMARSS